MKHDLHPETGAVEHDFDILPSVEQLEKELQREKHKCQYINILRSTIWGLVIVAAVAVLITVFLFPGLRIYGNSMTPTLQNGEIVFSVKTTNLKPGDIVAFYYNNNVLIKRVICSAGDWLDIEKDGTVYVNGEMLDEPYLTEKALGSCDITLPYQVPDGRIFVMGDHRSTSIDSRNASVGCVSQEQIVGKVTFRIWPISRLGALL